LRSPKKETAMANWQEFTGQQGVLYLNLSRATCIKADSTSSDTQVLFDGGQSYRVKQSRDEVLQRAKVSD
jgi:hypothetical protein